MTGSHSLRRSLVAIAASSAAVVALWSLAHGAPREGEVVRVERGAVTTGSVRACMLPSRSGPLACFGGPTPRAGETVTLVASDGHATEVTVTSARPSTYDRCGLGSMYDVDFRDTQSVTSTRGHRTAFGVRGLRLSPGRAKLITDHGMVRNTPGLPREVTIWFALDTDGNGSADLVGAHSECSAAKRAAPRRPSGRTLSALCLDYFERRGTRYVRTNRDLFYSCF